MFGLSAAIAKFSEAQKEMRRKIGENFILRPWQKTITMSRGGRHFFP